MSDFILQIKDLRSFNLKGEIIKNLDIDLKASEVHALVGDNDFTTRTFIDAISGHEKNANGKVIFKGEELDIHLDQSEKSLKGRKYIEKAKGILMDRFGISEPKAMNRLQKMSKDTNKKMIDVAKGIIEADDILS